jgi:outer membrane protein
MTVRFTRTFGVSLLAIGAALSLPALRAAEDEPANAVHMTLSECLTRALENNLDLRIAKLDPESAGNLVTFQDAFFDPVLGAHASYGETDASFQTVRTDILNPPATTSDDADESKTTLAGVSLAQRLKFGADYAVALDGRKFDQSGDSFNPPNFFNLNTQDTKSVALGLQFNLHLLKGFGVEVNTLNLVLAKNDARISQEELQRRAQITLKAVEDGYWDVAAARAAVRVSKQSLKLAQDLYDLNKKKVEVGTLAPIEITQAEAGVASREEGVIVAENLLSDTEDNLRRLMAVPKDDPLWGQPIIPTDKPKSEGSAPNLDEALATAMQKRPEIRNAQVAYESSELAAKVAKKNIRHTLDLAVNLNSSRYENAFDTLAGTPAIPVFTTDINNGKGGPDWSVGLVYAYPIGNRAEKATAANAEIDRLRSEITIASTEQDVRVDVRTAVRAVASGAQRVAAAHSNTVLQQKTVDAELKKFENGMSTSFEVLRIQTDLSDAQVAEIRAVLDYNKSLADLERAKGTLLESKGLALASNSGR